MIAGIISNWNRRPKAKYLKCLLFFCTLSWKPTETKAIGEIVAARVLKDSDSTLGKSILKAARHTPRIKATKGGKSTIFFSNDSDCFLLEYIPATSIPKVESTINVPGRSTIMSVLVLLFRRALQLPGFRRKKYFLDLL